MLDHPGILVKSFFASRQSSLTTPLPLAHTSRLVLLLRKDDAKHGYNLNPACLHVWNQEVRMMAHGEGSKSQRKSWIQKLLPKPFEPNTFYNTTDVLRQVCYSDSMRV